MTESTYIGSFIVVVSAAIYLDIAISMPAAAWPFEFPGAYAVARTLSSDNVGARLKTATSTEDLYEIIKDSEKARVDKLSASRQSRRHGGSSSGGKIPFRRAMGTAITAILIFICCALVACRAAGHRTLVFGVR